MREDIALRAGMDLPSWGSVDREDIASGNVWPDDEPEGGEYAPDSPFADSGAEVPCADSSSPFATYQLPAVPLTAAQEHELNVARRARRSFD